MATLSTRDQKEMDTLNDDIRELKQENKKAFAERMRLEAQVNKLENLLTNNLNRRQVRIQRLRRQCFSVMYSDNGYCDRLIIVTILAQNDRFRN